MPFENVSLRLYQTWKTSFVSDDFSPLGWPRDNIEVWAGGGEHSEYSEHPPPQKKKKCYKIDTNSMEDLKHPYFFSFFFNLLTSVSTRWGGGGEN